MPSERAREREVNRYYQTWLDSSYGYNNKDDPATTHRYHKDGSSLRPSNDKTLIAFAQLGCLRLNAKRGIVTLIGSDRQHVLAEATKTLSLISELTDDDTDDELWFGNASLPRSQGISEAALTPPEYTAIGPKGQTYTAPALVINDITKHDLYKEKAYAGNGISFYCGVPIISHSGHCVGVYTITDDKPRDGLSLAELVFMEDMAKIIMRHLETVSNDAARFRGERLVIGLGNFMRGKSSMGFTPTPLANADNIPQDKSQSPFPKPLVDQNDLTRPFKGMTITNADPSILRQVQVPQDSFKRKADAMSSTALRPETGRRSIPATLSGQETEQDHDKDNWNRIRSANGEKPSKPTSADIPSISRPHKLEKVFARAASILRECATADGVVFFDATSTNLAKRSGTSEFEPARESSEEDHSTGTSDETNSDSTDNFYPSSGPSTDSEGVSDGRPTMLNSKGKQCRMLGYSLDVSMDSTASANTTTALGLTERSLRHFIRRYPRGKIFYFTAVGEVSTSESERSDRAEQSDRIERATNPASTPDKVRRGNYKRLTSNEVAEELIRIVPGARIVVWLPLWDFHKQRWCAGTFLWSRRAEDLLTAQDDLAYLKTFGHSIMIAVSRIDAESADEAKATFIANISHELRSPLHGILGSVEFLQETSLDAFQTSMALGVETCAKTLLDTVEHVLDYSKISQMSTRFSKNRSGGISGPKGRRTKLHNDLQIKADLHNDLDLANLFEEAVEAVYAGQTFRNPGRYQKEDSPITDAESEAGDSVDTIRANIGRRFNKLFGAVRLILKITRMDNWWTHVEPGAIRRIVMNILGNALKYTDRGIISISLSSAEPTGRDDRARTVCMTVKDTGRGMSGNFLRNHAFTPFSQESKFSTGTGLGLSIVRQIVNSLGGRIELHSEKNIGTEIKVFIPLPSIEVPANLDSSTDILALVMQKTRGLSLCILDPEARDGSKPDQVMGHDSVEETLRELAESWFGMRTMKAKTMKDLSVDFIIYTEPPPIEHLLKHHGSQSDRSETPFIIMTANAFESASLTAKGIGRLTDLGSVEILSQPCGPQKLAKAFHRCFSRLESLAPNPDKSSSNLPVPIEDSDDLNTKSGLMSSGAFSGHSYFDQAEPPQGRVGRLYSNDAERPQYSRRTTGKSIGESEMSLKIPPSGAAVPWLSRTSSGAHGSEADSYNHLEAKPPVLLVDDNDINLNLLIAFMNKAKHPFETARDGLQAVQAFERAVASNDPAKQFKYILMDISMPVMDGIEATRCIRQHEKRLENRSQAMVIALTGLGVQTEQDMLDAGADYYVAKPVKFKELMRLFRN